MFGSGRGQQHSTPRPIDVPTRGYGQADDRPCRHTSYTTGPMLNGTKATRVSSNEKRRARQDAYRQELDVQVAEDRERRNLDAQKIREVEKRHELKSATYNPWGKPGCGAPLRQADGALVTNVKAYYRAKLQGLVAQDLSPNEISDGEQPFGFTLSAEETSSTEGAGNGGGTRRRAKETTVSLSPPRNRYRFDRLPPEEKTDLDRRLNSRRELEAALYCQVEEKRRRREREMEAKRQEDEADRVRVLKVLAEDRAAFRGRARNKNLRAGEAPTMPQDARGFGSARVPTIEVADDADPRGRVAWQLKPETCGTHPVDRFSAFEDNSFSRNGTRSFLGVGGEEGRVRKGGSATRGGDAGGVGLGVGGDDGGGGGGVGVRSNGRGAAAGGGDEGSRLMHVLRKLEDHGKMLEKLASEMATIKASRDNYKAQAGARKPHAKAKVSFGLGVLDEGLNGGALPARGGKLASTSSLSPLYRTFQQDEDQLDRLLQRFEHSDGEPQGDIGFPPFSTPARSSFPYF